ncbi:MAG: histone deacetylase family protein [Gammaproteobacteria bacterium]|nr:histone deacetylase family protein [Gammaproteobacteria bacterium]
MAISLISHPDCALHEMGSHHPESPARLSAIQDQLISSGLDMVLQHHDAPLASREQLCRVHDPEYVDSIFHKAPDQGMVWLDPDTCMNPHTLYAALRAAGAVVLGVDLVMSGQSEAAFCNVRPPGHHAEHNKAMGFCIFNNIAVGAAHTLQTHQLKRIAIIDFDVHHGNGTEDIFRETPEVLLCSTFQHPFYPNTGSHVVANHIVNVPLAAGTGSVAFRTTVKSNWLPRLEAFQPELILISAGFDAHVEDDMANLHLVEQDYAWVTREIKTIADKYAKGRIVSALEGGYALSALGRCVAAHLNALLG